MKVLVIGATGGTGRVLVNELLAKGHEVTAFARRPKAMEIVSPRLRTFKGDALEAADLRRAVKGQDAVAVVLGITENPLWVRLRGSRSTALDIRSQGTRNVIDAMRAEGIERIVVQTTYGAGDTRDRLPLKWKMIFSMLLKPQIADSEVQEEIVRESGLDWTLVRPVNLTDDDDAAVFVSTDGEVPTMNVSRSSVARLLTEALETTKYQGSTIAISAAA